MDVYGFIGTPGCDLVIYLGILIRNLGRSVLILDCAKEAELISEGPGDKGTVYNVCGIDITDDAGYFKQQHDNFDTGLILADFEQVLYGENWGGGLEPAAIWGITDMQSRNMRKLKEGQNAGIVFQDIILRDTFLGMDRACFIRTWNLPGRMPGNCLELPLDLLDYEKRIMTAHAPVRNLKGLSREFQILLQILAGRITGIQERAVKAAYKKSERRIRY